jgi:DNA-binding transcriptional MerR regulator
LVTIRKWQHAGLSLERIRELLAKPDTALLLPPPRRRPGTVEVCSHLIVADGVEIVLEPGRANLSPEQVRTFFRGVSHLYQQLQGVDDASNE